MMTTLFLRIGRGWIGMGVCMCGMMLSGTAGCHQPAQGAQQPDAPATASAPATVATTPADGEEPLVDVHSVDPRIIIDIRYATPNNFMKRRLYPVNRALLRRSVARRLKEVQDELSARGLGLKIYDGYRPLSIQRAMWEAYPHPGYVADPKKGSRHNRGAAVDLTLVDAQGRELPMPSDYDEFTERAHRKYAGGSQEARRNRDLLIKVMERHGFRVLDTEWWHFDATDWRKYGLLDVPLDAVASRPVE